MKLVHTAKQVLPGLSSLFCCFGDNFVDSEIPLVFSAFYCASVSWQLPEEVSSFSKLTERERERKGSSVGKISVKPKIQSLVV